MKDGLICLTLCKHLGRLLLGDALDLQQLLLGCVGNTLHCMVPGIDKELNISSTEASDSL